MNSHIIHIRDLSVTLSGNEILKGVSLDVGPGEYVSIIGPNGAGKTTLIKCMAGIHAGWSGTMELCGKPFRSYSTRERAQLQSYVPQAEGRSHPFSVETFVSMGRYPHLSAFTSLKAGDYRAIGTAIEQAGLQDLRHRAVNTLSGGERQMVFIAAALAQEARILLLDEPATFLDYRHQAAVNHLLRGACRENGITVIAVHHDINAAAASSDRIHALKEGKVIFSGAPAEATTPDVLQRIYDTRFICTSSPDGRIPFVSAGGTA